MLPRQLSQISLSTLPRSRRPTADAGSPADKQQPPQDEGYGSMPEMHKVEGEAQVEGAVAPLDVSAAAPTTSGVDAAPAPAPGHKRSSSQLSTTSSSTDASSIDANFALLRDSIQSGISSRQQEALSTRLSRLSMAASDASQVIPFDPFTTPYTIDRGTMQFRPKLLPRAIEAVKLGSIAEGELMEQEEEEEDERAPGGRPCKLLDEVEAEPGPEGQANASPPPRPSLRLAAISEESLPYYEVLNEQQAQAQQSPSSSSPGTRELRPLGRSYASSKTSAASSASAVPLVKRAFAPAREAPSLSPSNPDRYHFEGGLFRQVEEAFKQACIDDNEGQEGEEEESPRNLTTNIEHGKGTSSQALPVYRSDEGVDQASAPAYASSESVRVPSSPSPTTTTTSKQPEKKRLKWFAPFFQTKAKDDSPTSKDRGGEKGTQKGHALDFLGGAIRKSLNKGPKSTPSLRHSANAAGAQDSMDGIELPELRASEAPPTAPQRLRKAFDDKYTLVKKLGSGGHSVVHLATHQQTDTSVAVKIFYSATVWHWYGTSKPYEPLEIQLMRTFAQDPAAANIAPRFIESFTFEDEHIIVMEHLGDRWTDLYEYLETYGYLSEEVVLKIFRNVLTHILQLYRLGYTHNDIKDENIMINHDTLETRLIDFGSATRTDSRSIHTEIYGTKKFACPESLKDSAYSPLAQESWALGALLYILCFQVDPFANTDEVFTVNMEARLLRSQTTAHLKGFYYSSKILGIIKKCLSMNPSQRYSLTDLEQLFLQDKLLR